MKKIGKAWFLAFLAGLFLNSFAAEADAQNNVTVEATVSEATVYEGEQIKLNITVSGDFSDISMPDLPNIPGFRVISSTPSTSRRFSYVNGVSKTSYTYTYYLAAQKKGAFTIPPISIKVDSKAFTTQPIEVEIINRSRKATGDTGESDIFLKLEIADKTVVPGEQIIANIVLYFKDNMQVRTYQPVPGWKAAGFWKEQLNNAERPEVKSLTLNGVRYNKARLLRVALFPTKTGELTVSPFQVNVVAYSAPAERNPFSSFFGNSGARKQLELTTDSVTIKVNPLPRDSSSDFTGAVGSFNMQREISADTVKIGETLEIKTTISGTGNIPLLEKPNYNLPDNLELYEPKSDENIDRSGAKIKGSKTFTDLVVPRNAGSITIPASTISWYNPAKQKFIEKKLPAKTVYVNASGLASTNPSNEAENDVSPITGLVNWGKPEQKDLISNWWLWAGLLLPVLILALAYRKKYYDQKMRNDYSFARSQKAAEAARQRLHEAVDHAENQRMKQAYNSLQKALTGFIADKTKLPEAGLSIEQYIEELEVQGVNEDLIKNVRMLLNKCATVNYAPDSSAGYLKSHVNLAKSIIKKLKREL
ncbi:MAG TPA: BatD family protein [Balneolaceae bacterium]|nr:BatD family protein [Balneolaceae bacterium]